MGDGGAQLETVTVAALAGFVGLKGIADIQALLLIEKVALGAALLCLTVSIHSGTTVLNSLPAAVQRSPSNQSAKTSDIYTIRPYKRPIGFWTRSFRYSFIGAVVSIVAFIFFRVAFVRADVRACL